MVKTGYSKRKRADGLWMGWAWESPAGKRHYLYDRDRTSLRIRVEDLAQQLQLDKSAAFATLETFSAHFLETHAGEYAASTLKGYNSIHQNHIQNSKIGNMFIDEIKHSDIQAFIANAELKKKTVKNIVGYMRTLFTAALHDGLIQHSPIAGKFKYKAEVPYKYSIYSVAELSKLIDSYSDNDIDRVPVLLAAFCGMRLGEVMGLRGEAIDLQNGTITVDLAAVGVSSSVDIKPPKTATSVRKIAMPKIVQDALAPFVHDGFIFSDDGSPWNGGNYTRRFRYHLQANNLPPTRFHDLRHFSATALMAAGLSDKQISTFLGHSDTNITHRYQHILDNIQSRPAEIFDSLMKK